MKAMHGILITLLMVGCAEMPGESAGEQADSSANPAMWMLGTWDCTGSYGNVPPYGGHSVTAVYAFDEDVQTEGVVRATYTEISATKDFALLTIGELWTFDAFNPAVNNAPITLGALGDDGSVVTAAGVSRGPLPKTTVKGSLSAPGQITIDGTTRDWRTSATATTPPDRFGMTRLIGVAPGFLQQYFNMNCTKRI